MYRGRLRVGHRDGPAFVVVVAGRIEAKGAEVGVKERTAVDFALGHGFVEHSPDENVIMHPTGFDRPDGAFNPLHQAILKPIESLDDERRSRVMFAMIPPMMPLGLVSDHMFYFLILPSGANKISFMVSY